ncbi:RNA 3'-terminal phosphate cyclase [Geoalkalibacter halelectricus]|uniref:RNA 3'-terminal phosphate cyclase n=1 Tax=Geoalkalibacter halelectricus TaxID=2847045 RepID=UPI003D1E702F
MPYSPLEIDGSLGEGGGQILRTALSLSLLTRRPLRMVNIRAGRHQPGLAPQHLQAVEAATVIGGAACTGAHRDSQHIEFAPQGLFPGSYHFDIGTAGSVGLVLQTLLVPLAFAPAPSRLLVRGGTHVPWSPCYHYLEHHWLPCLREMGFRLELSLEAAGYYPRGGGEVRALVHPVQKLDPLSFHQRGNLEKLTCLSLATGLPRHVAERQALQAQRRLSRFKAVLNLEMGDLPGRGQGSMLMLLAEFEGGRCCYYALGQRGKPAEQVADEAVEALEQFLTRQAAIDEYLADQLLLPLALTSRSCGFTTAKVTPHLLTNSEVIMGFLPVDIHVEGALGGVGRVRIGDKAS